MAEEVTTSTRAVPMHAKPLSLDDQLCFALYAAANEIVRSYRGRLAELDLTYPQYLVMLALWQDGPRSMTEIGERLMLGANAITPLVARLEKAGFVSRTRDEDDRRIVRIALTEAGRALEREAAAVQAVVECQTGLDRPQLDALRTELMDLAQRLKPQEDPRPPGSEDGL